MLGGTEEGHIGRIPKSHYFFFFVVLGLELRAYTLSLSTSPVFMMGFFEIGFQELFAQAGFKA
jgi:hypothetical protein